MHHQVVCAVVRPGQLLCGTPLQQMLCDYHGETLSLLCNAPNIRPLLFVEHPWASPCVSFPGWGVAQHSAAPWDTKSRGERSQVGSTFGAAWSRDCVCCWSHSSLYPWACAFVLSSNGENHFLKTQMCHKLFYEFRCFNWC